MILAITGHRPQRLKGQEKLIKEWAAEQLIRLQPSAIYDGMAQGADQIIATAAKELGIPVICCYPFPKNIIIQLNNGLQKIIKLFLFLRNTPRMLII